MLSRSKLCIPFIKSLPPSIHNLFNKSVKKAISQNSQTEKGGIFQGLDSFKHSFLIDLMDLEAPRIPVVSSKEATDVSLMRTQSHLTYLNLSMNARQHVKTSKKHPLLWKAVTLWGRGLWQLEPGAWFWFWDVPLGGKHVLGLYSLSLSFWYQIILTADSQILYCGLGSRIELKQTFGHQSFDGFHDE